MYRKFFKRFFDIVLSLTALVVLSPVLLAVAVLVRVKLGSPVKIDSLARNLIKLSGLKPDVDIKIEYTGLRPGEKLYEEKLMEEEGLRKTDNDLIHIGCPIPFDADQFLTQMKELMNAAYLNHEDIRRLVADVVPTYHPAEEVSQVVSGKKTTMPEFSAEAS